MGAVLFGYDTGVAGGVISLESFQHDFGLIGDELKVANLKANVVSVLQAGCFFGAVFGQSSRLLKPHRVALTYRNIL